MQRRALEERFWEKVQKTDTCWFWTGYIHTRTGYGRISMGGRRGPVREAHRVAWELTYGSVPNGLELDHLCRVRHCVRPTHLEAVTHLVNTRRGMTAEVARARQLAKTHCPQNHPYDGTNLVIDEKGRRRCRTCRNTQRRQRSAKIKT